MRRLPLVWLGFLLPGSVAIAAQDQPRADSTRIYGPGELEKTPAIKAIPPVRGFGSVQRRVVVRTVVDAQGRPEAGTQEIVETEDSGLDGAAEELVQAMIFKPGQVHGHSVRTRVDVPVLLTAPNADSQPADTAVMTESMVEEKPAIVWGPPLSYPPDLRQQGIQGRVIVQAIIDTIGRPEPNSIRILRSPDYGLDAEALNYVRGARFRPARHHGQRVRVLVQIPLDFRIRIR